MKLRSLSYKLKVVVVCVAHDQDQRHTVAAVLTNTHQLPPQWCQVSLVPCHPAQGLLLVALGSLPKFCLDVTELQGERKRKIKVQLIHQNWATQPTCIRLFHLERNGFTHYSYVKTCSSLWTIHTGTYYLARHTPLLGSFSLYVWNSVWFIARLVSGYAIHKHTCVSAFFNFLSTVLNVLLLSSDLGEPHKSCDHKHSV